jgi:hypothetical protein
LGKVRIALIGVWAKLRSAYGLPPFRPHA